LARREVKVVSDPIPIWYDRFMDAASTLRTARARSGLSLRRLARRAGTSHSTLAAYEAGRVVPSVATLERIVRAAGFELEVDLLRRVEPLDANARGRELLDALELAAQFPTRHRRTIEFPAFPGTASPGTASPGTASPGTASPGTASPGTASPGTASPRVAGRPSPA
jgi:transcriptional regulator with XRE-family HTH domain